MNDELKDWKRSNVISILEREYPSNETLSVTRKKNGANNKNVCSSKMVKVSSSFLFSPKKD